MDTIFTLVPPAPFLRLYLEDVNATSVSISWIVSGIPDEATITVSNNMLHVRYFLC